MSDRKGRRSTAAEARFRRALRRTLIVLAVCVVAACGGGDDDDNVRPNELAAPDGGPATDSQRDGGFGPNVDGASDGDAGRDASYAGDASDAHDSSDASEAGDAGDAGATHSVSGTLHGLAAGTSLIMTNNGGDPLNVAANGNFVFAAKLSSGSTYRVVIATAPLNQICHVIHGKQLVDAIARPALDVRCSGAVARFAYVAHQARGTVGSYVVDQATSQLRPTGFTPIIGQPIDVAVEPTGRFAYVPRNIASAISVFAIDSLSGRLTPVGAPVSTGSRPQAMTIDPSGRFAYVPNDMSNNVSAFAIDAATGGLTAVPGSPFASGKAPRTLAIDPTGRFAYAPNTVDGTLSAYAIDDATGALSPVGLPVVTGANPRGLTIEPTGRFAYATSASANTVSAYTIDAISGALTLAGAPVATGASPYATAVAPRGRHVYVANRLSNDVSAYEIDPLTGALTPIGAPVPAGSGPAHLRVDPSGQVLYVSNSTQAMVSTLRIDAASGALSPYRALSDGETPGPVEMVRGTSPVIVQPRFVYTANAIGGAFSRYVIDPVTGALTSGGADVGTGSIPSNLVTDWRGRLAFAAFSSHLSGGPASFSVDNAIGSLTATSGPFLLGGGGGVATTRDARYVFGTEGGRVYAYTADAVTGALTANGGATVSTSQLGIPQVDPAGKFVYIPVRAGEIRALAINPGTGVVTEVPGSPFSPARLAVSLRVHPSGLFVYACSLFVDALLGFRVDPVTGALSALPGSPFTPGASCQAMDVHPGGGFAYMIGQDFTLRSYAIDFTTGALTAVGQPAATGATPVGVAVDPSGRFVYVTSLDNFVQAYVIDALNGSVTASGAPLPTGTKPINIHVTATLP